MVPIRFADGATFPLDPPRVMGILNVTPDSFSDGGRFLAPDAAVAHGVALVAAGADLLDVGGESTRPGAAPVPAAEQIARVVPVIRALAGRVAAPISIDTTRADVAAAALDAGARIVNDVTAGRGDAALLPLAARRGCPVVLMHMRGTPRTMQSDIRYDDVVEEVAVFLGERADAARRAGVAADRIVLDPGIGFGKTAAHNLRLVRELGRLRAIGYPVLLGPSRKAFIGALTGRPPAERVMGTAGVVAAGILAGAAIVRVHDVAAMVDVVRVVTAIRDSSRAPGRRGSSAGDEASANGAGVEGTGGSRER